MFSRNSEVSDELVNDIVYKSMNIYPSSANILPIIISIDTERLINLGKIPVYTGQQMRCRHCCAYFNPYSIIHDHPSVWKCSVCGLINQLPLPPSNSFDTGFSLARSSVPYNNTVFDIVSQPKHFRENRNLIIVAIHSHISNETLATISESVKNNENTDYILIFFGVNVEVYNKKMNCFQVLCIDDEDAFLPASISEMKMDGESLKAQIMNVKYSEKDFMNIYKLSSLVKEIENMNFAENGEYAPTRLIIYTNGISSPHAVSIKSITHLCAIGRSKDSLYHLEDFVKEPGSRAVSIPDEKEKEKIDIFSQQAFSSKVITRQSIQFFHNRSCTGKTTSANSRIIEIDRCYYSGQNLSMIVQAEVKFYVRNDKTITRVVAMKIPLGIDVKIYNSMTFKRPYRCLYSVASYFVDRMSEMMKDQRLFQVRNTVLDIAHKYPFKGIFKNFVFSIFMSKAIAEEESPLQRRGILNSLSTLEQPLQFLFFLPLEIKGKNVFPIYPTSSPEADIRICHDMIYARDTIEDPVEEVNRALKLIDAEFLFLPISVVKEFPKVDKSREFSKWSESWETNSYDMKKITNI